MPSLMRTRVTSLIERGRTDRQILEELVEEYGFVLLQPHLAP
jgi:cytochrome c-type biogenesis protein CcmH/NrfF